MHVEHITPIAKLNLILQVNETIVMHIHLSKGLYQAQAGDNPNNGDKEIVFKNCALLLIA